MEVKAQSEKAAILSQVKKALFTRNQHNEQSHFIFRKNVSLQKTIKRR